MRNAAPTYLKSLIEPESMIKDVVKKCLIIMKEEIKNFLVVNKKDTSNSKNEYFKRSFGTKYGKADDFSMSSNRNGAIFKPKI